MADNKQQANHHDYVFRLHNAQSDQTQVKCWQELQGGMNAARLASIKDVIDTNSQKVGSSIPTPLSRIRLFDTAFEMVDRHGHDGNTMYHQLVSDCLDMIQLLFMNGIDGQENGIQVIPFQIDQELEQMKNSQIGGHSLLGEALSLYLGSNSGNGVFAKMDTLHMIFYKGKLLGGTSPLTLCFTAPTWRDQGITVASTTDDVLFDNDFWPLHQRSYEFQEFLQKFRKAHREFLSQTAPNFFNYLKNSIEQNEQLSKQLTNYEGSEFNEEYDMLQDPQTENYLSVAGLRLYKFAESNIQRKINKSSDLTIKPNQNVNIWKQKLNTSQNGDENENIFPLVLMSEMDLPFPATYTDKEWSNAISFPENMQEDNIMERTLPDSGGVNYPFVTVPDFFEERIITLHYPLNNDDFFTGSQDDSTILLPIKDKYFWFFSIEDLRKNLSVDYPSEDRIKFTLQVPIQNGKTIEFKKEYDLNNDEISIENEFNLAISPFFKVTTDKQESGDKFNSYDVYLIENIEYERPVSLTFLKQSEELADIPSNHAERITRESSDVRSTHYQVDGSFDFIKVSASADPPLSGFIIPMMKEFKNGHRSVYFGIDFGTTNTHVSYKVDNTKVNDLTFENSDRLITTLNKGSEYGRLELFPTTLQREFLPKTIGAQSGDTRFDSYPISFPIRTTMFENTDFASKNKAYLFDDLNIGFHFDSDESKDKGGFYSTNLKWRFETGGLVAGNRVRAFMHELVKLIKHKTLLNYGDLSKVIINRAYPSSMKEDIRSGAGGYEEIWLEEIQKVIGKSEFEHEGKEELRESVAPYYYLKENMGDQLKQNPQLNIDIGGGTTDVLLVNPKTESHINTSFKLAGDDLWGDPPESGAHKKNPYLITYQNDNEDLINKSTKSEVFYNIFDDQNVNSEDVISLLFKHDDEFKFSEYFNKNAKELKLGTVIHYAAIIYHLVQWVNEYGEEFPNNLSFTGQGSLYIRFLFRKKQHIEEFTKLLLASYGVEKFQNGNKLNIILNDEPKKVTAHGLASYTDGSNESININHDNIKTCTYIGGQFDDAPSYIDSIDINESSEQVQPLIDNFKNFIEYTFNNQSIQDFLEGHQLYYSEYVHQFFNTEDRALELFKNYLILQQRSSAKEKKITETLFFYPLKYGFHEVLNHLKEQMGQ